MNWPSFAAGLVAGLTSAARLFGEPGHMKAPPDPQFIPLPRRHYRHNDVWQEVGALLRDAAERDRKSN